MVARRRERGEGVEGSSLGGGVGRMDGCGWVRMGYGWSLEKGV